MTNDLFTDVPICIALADFNRLPDMLFRVMSTFYLMSDIGLILESWFEECVGGEQ